MSPAFWEQRQDAPLAFARSNQSFQNVAAAEIISVLSSED